MPGYYEKKNILWLSFISLVVKDIGSQTRDGEKVTNFIFLPKIKKKKFCSLKPFLIHSLMDSWENKIVWSKNCD